MTSLRRLALLELDPRLAAAQAWETMGNEALGRADDETEAARRCFHEARSLREAVEGEREAADLQREADAELAPVRGRRA